MTQPILGHISLYDMMMYFFIYAFLGWISEVIFATLKTGKFVNRGFLNGPVCPIYGVGMAICVLLLNTLADKWWLLFIVGVALSTFLELVTGFVLDKAFKTKWWDYSKEPFNFKGYICLRFSLIWGIAITLVFKTLVPLTDKIISFIPFKWAGCVLLIGLWITFIIDFVVVIMQLRGLNKDLKEIRRISEFIHGGSDKIGEKISGATETVVAKLGELTDKIKNSRLGKAFPSVAGKGGKTEKTENVDGAEIARPDGDSAKEVDRQLNKYPQNPQTQTDAGESLNETKGGETANETDSGENSK